MQITLVVIAKNATTTDESKISISCGHEDDKNHFVDDAKMEKTIFLRSGKWYNKRATIDKVPFSIVLLSCRKDTELVPWFFKNDKRPGENRGTTGL